MSGFKLVDIYELENKILENISYSFIELFVRYNITEYVFKEPFSFVTDTIYNKEKQGLDEVKSKISSIKLNKSTEYDGTLLDYILEFNVDGDNLLVHDFYALFGPFSSDSIKYIYDKIEKDLYKSAYCNVTYINKDIVITDPCYIVKDNNSYSSKYKLNTDAINSAFYKYGKSISYLNKRIPLDKITLKEIIEDWDLRTKIQDHINNYIDEHKSEIIEDDWNKCKCGHSMESIGFKDPYLCESTIYGDWSCTVFDSNNNEVGNFCADAGLFIVCTLDDIMNYGNQEFINRLGEYTNTVIKNFSGTVKINDTGEGYDMHRSIEFYDLNGKLQYITKQTGL